MFCTNCGKTIKENAKFCPECGTTAKWKTVTETVEKQPDQQRQNQPEAAVVTTQTQSKIQPAPKKKSRKALFGIAGGAAAAVLVFMLVIFPAIGSGGGSGSDVTNTGAAGSEDLTINIYIEPPGGREVSFNVTEAGFSTNDPAIKMIEINQGLSYGFDSDTGEFYIMDSFIAGKETAVFIDLEKPLDPKSEVRLTIEKDGEHVVTLTSIEEIDATTLLFQPKDMSDAGFWEEGAYTFTFEMDNSVATRTTNFFKSMPMRILAVPIAGNYSGDIRRCEDDWKQGYTMITATYPLARDDVEYILGPEQDLSDPKYDLNTKEGRKEVWLALRALQTPNDDYTMIVGFMRTPTKQGYLGYTYGEPATIVCESEPDLLATVVHEIAHCYNIGDEYEGGSLNDGLNPPPHGMKGKDIITRDPAVGTKEKVIGGYDYGLKGSGSVIYPEQRAYWPEGRQLLGATSSIMGEGTGAESFTFWTSSDIWNHLFESFTGQFTAKGFGTGSQASENGGQGEYWGLCCKCFGDVYSPLVLIECKSCFKFVPVTDEEFSCGECGSGYKLADFSDNDMWIYHPACNSVIYYPDFTDYNSGTNTGKSSSDSLMVLEITGDIDGSGAFSANPWYAYEASPSVLTANMDGEYSAYVYDSKGELLSRAYFDAADNSQISTKESIDVIEDAGIPIRVVVKFPDEAAKVVIQKGGSEVFAKELSANRPEVSFKGLKEGQELSNNVTLKWEASDADGDDLTFQIWYCVNDAEFLVATDVKGTSYDADLTDYPGSKKSWFRILASDGARTGMNESPKVDVPFRAPDILNVIPEGTQYKVTEEVEIQGKVHDAQDGWLWDKGYEWRVDGRLWQNYGNFFFTHAPYMLEPGFHTITLKATNSAGVSSSKDYVIEILEDESDLPNDWSRNDITLALRIGYYLPLDKLESPVTRIEYAKLMFSVMALVYPIDYGKVVAYRSWPEITDMNNDLNNMDFYYALSMVQLGLMDAPDGKFDPYGSITEREAMQAMYMGIQVARTERAVTYEVLDDSVFLPELIEWGMLDEAGGPNEYKAGEKLTNRLTMVRIARFLRYEEDLEEKDYGVAAGFFNNYYAD